MFSTFRLWTGLALLLTLCLGSGAQRVEAHGGGTAQLANAEAGPYWVSVWTQPHPARVGQWHVTVAVSEPPEGSQGRGEPGPPVLDATVAIRLEPLDRAGEAQVALATHQDSANKIFYEADLELPAEGRWQVEVAVDGAAGSGSSGFELQVLPASRLNINWAWIGGLGLVVLAAAWFFVGGRGR